MVICRRRCGRCYSHGVDRVVVSGSNRCGSTMFPVGLMKLMTIVEMAVLMVVKAVLVLVEV